MPNKITLICIFLIYLLTGCSLAPNRVDYLPHAKGNNKELLVKNKLYNQYDKWKGTNYRLGGLNKNGIDCSGFVFITFKSKFGIILPRTTQLQVTTGKRIEKTKLQAGDLVFFKTGKLTRHVGIYLEHGKFLHASTSHGVTISSLDNIYWKSKFWKAKRIKS